MKSDECLCFVWQEYTCLNLHSWKWTTVWSHLCGKTSIPQHYVTLLHPERNNSTKNIKYVITVTFPRSKPWMTFLRGTQQKIFSRILILLIKGVHPKMKMLSSLNPQVFQICMSFFLLPSKKEDILNNVGNQNILFKVSSFLQYIQPVFFSTEETNSYRFATAQG